MNTLFGLACLAVSNIASAQTDTNKPVLGIEKAMELPISDAHFHVMGPFMQPEALLRMMDKHKIKWAGGAGYMAPDARMAKFRTAMGQRLKYFGGQRESVNAYANFGAAPFEDPNHPAAMEMLAQIEAGLKDGRFKGIGELHVNTLYTAPMKPGLRRKLPVDAPTFKAMFNLAQKYKSPIDMHIEWDSDTVEQLERMLAAYPGVSVKLAHCGKTSSPDDIRLIMGKHANVYCDLSSRPGQHKAHHPSVVIFTDNGFQHKDWRQVIEDFPDRFTVGIDDVDSWNEYEQVVETIRKGLLANLSPEAAEKVAYKNADRLYGGQ
jgi:predicted TIM-barrel fold metal-dependent hydrolase